MSLLELRAVDAYYGHAKVLHGVSIGISAAERVAILGRNGAGKTTLVNSFLGIAEVGAGSILLNGHEARAIAHFDAARSGIAVVPQGRRILPNLTVEENLLLGAAVRRGGQWDLGAIYRLFPVLQERRDVSGIALSGGQQQMLAIGRALMANPELLVLDEPSEGLAPVIVDELARVFAGLGREGTGILLIEQNFSLVRRVAERYYVLSKGAIVDQGKLQGLSLETLKRHVAV
ncbi:MAG TPA: ABC transporter ATP-binding protein [Alphaproteobacteria bacterium]|nr:ABC transporter ATP-binding protein [Alphaproteobacteria bacterium]